MLDVPEGGKETDSTIGLSFGSFMAYKRRPKQTSVINMKLDIRENKAVAWIELALNMFKWHTFVNMVMNLWDPQEYRISRPIIM